jgi:7-cyano-7-deazaguanine reductase
MTQIGDTAADCISGIEARVKRDLDELLDTNTTVTFFASEFETEPLSFSDEYQDIADIAKLDDIDFTAFKSDADQLETGEGEELKVRSNLLRSNCRVTNQPDWGDVFIYIKGEEVPSAESLAKYIVSHRTVSHFHEEICEMIFAHLTERFKPEQLMVSCLYTRRGGIDINPIRATHNMLIPEFFTNPNYTIRKTLRQ